MASVIQPGDLGSDQQNQGQTTNGVNQAGQTSSTNTANQAGQAPVQAQNGAAPSTSTSGSSGGNSSGQNAGQTAGNQSTGSGSAAPAGASNVYNPNKQQGSGYTNIQKVLSANQGNQLGSAVGQNLQNTETQAQQNLQSAQSQFNQQTQANQANTQANQQLAQNVLADPTQYVAQGTNTPSAANSQNASQFTNLLSGQYQGPTALTNAQQLQNQAANVAQQGQALQTSGGRIGLLQQMIGNPNYSTGDANLDSLLLGQSNSPALQQAKQQALGLTGQVNNAVAGAAAQGQQQAAQAQQFGQALQGQLANNITSQTQALQQQATQAQQTSNQQYQQALSDLQSGNVTPAEAQALGLTQGENVYNLLNGNNAAQFLTENPNQANIANTATQQQYAQMQALQQLGGQYLSQPATQALQNFQNPSLAGTYASQQNLIGNQPAFSNALAATASNYNSIYQPAQEQLQNAQNISNWSQGQGITQDQINSFLAANANNPMYANNPYANASNPAFMAQVGESLIQQNDPGAVTNNTTLAPWAASNLATSQTAYNNAMSELNSQYGTPETINIAPQSQYPTIAGSNS